ncbi:MAG: Ig-like domain-containing protein, partial [Mucilaginibacter sp.]
MGLNNKVAVFVKNFLYCFIAMIIFSCASQQKPQGGPRDRTPPKLLKATPANMTRNFKATEIRLDFDEYFTLKNPLAEINLSPAQEKIPTYKVSKKSIIIEFR